MKIIRFLICVGLYIRTSNNWLQPSLTWSSSDQSRLPQKSEISPLMTLFEHSRVQNSMSKRKKPSKMEGHVLGGQTIDIKKYPWLAQVTRLEMPHCGGVVVSLRVIITAAHCVVDDDRLVLDPEDFAVLLGSTTALEGRKFEVCKIRIHKKHLKYKNPSYYYDLSLMLLSTQIKLNDKIQIAKIAPNKRWQVSKTIMAVAGYGVISNDLEDAYELRMTQLEFVDRRTCNTSPTDYGVLPVPVHMFCLISRRKTGDCVGDSGSGVMWTQYVVGIVSHGRANYCGSRTKPSMYVDLTYFRDWIEDNTKKLEAI